jgi:hypothetical protein
MSVRFYPSPIVLLWLGLTTSIAPALAGEPSPRRQADLDAVVARHRAAR